MQSINMQPETKILLAFIDYFILMGELNETVDAKNQLVRQQEYEEASNLRKKELSIRERIPTAQTFIDLKQELLNSLNDAGSDD